MATSLAHDINNPLASVTNLLFLLENEELSEDGKQYLATAQRELSRVAQISAQALGLPQQGRTSMALPCCHP